MAIRYYGLSTSIHPNFKPYKEGGMFSLKTVVHLSSIKSDKQRFSKLNGLSK